MEDRWDMSSLQHYIPTQISKFGKFTCQCDANNANQTCVGLDWLQTQKLSQTGPCLKYLYVFMIQTTNIFVYFEKTLQYEFGYTDLFSLSSFKANILHIGVIAEALCLAPSVTVWVDNKCLQWKERGWGEGLVMWGVGGGEEPCYTTLLPSISPILLSCPSIVSFTLLLFYLQISSLVTPFFSI